MSIPRVDSEPQNGKSFTVEESHERFMAMNQCHWHTKGNRCLLLHGFVINSPNTIRYCSWHGYVVKESHWIDDYSIFCEWQDRRRRTYPNPGRDSLLWVPHQTLWQATRGEIELEELILIQRGVTEEANKQQLAEAKEKWPQYFEANNFGELVRIMANKHRMAM